MDYVMNYFNDNSDFYRMTFKWKKLQMQEIAKYLFYYITFNYMPYNIPPAIFNIRQAISISSPISNITVGPGPISVIGPAFLQFD